MKHKQTREDLEGMTKADLVALAEKEGITVLRGDGEDGDPVKADYVEALSQGLGDTPSIVTSKSREKGPDETIPGGSYIVNGKRVNAHGKLIDEHGTVLEDE